MKQAVIGFVLMVVSGLAMAQLPSNDPAVVCNYLEVEQLPTDGWQMNDEGKGRCASQIRSFGREEVGPLHQLSYEARGNADSASILQVILDVNPPQAISEANKWFLQVSQRLSTNAFGKRLPSNISAAISGGLEATATIGNTTLSVNRQEHESGVGYQMRFSIQ
ncbi:hypothetical protein [Phytopseudomonas daroniae]|uniref:hypothetical protein n=1 Tax=Phytopseudomonas daroniae TaxID=2487519 RepID=UPI0010383607|nr:hypothetical protein [Pseudomonas daroniae]TBU73295.1 hypothetical protein DNK10_18700 [Pseudomonas daroniae]